MSEKGVDFEKYLTDSKWIEVKGFNFDNENERDNFFYTNGFMEKDDDIDIRLGILSASKDDRFKGVILIDGQHTDKEKAAKFTFDTTKKTFANSQGVELTPKDFQMLVGALGGDFGLWCILTPRKAGDYETIIHQDDGILKSRGKVL